MKYRRNTDMLVEEVILALTTGHYSLKPCALVNELGVIAIQNPDESVRAQEHLITLLEPDQTEEYRWISCRYLFDISRMGKGIPSLEMVLIKFKQDPANKSILPKEMVVRDEIAS